MGSPQLNSRTTSGIPYAVMAGFPRIFGEDLLTTKTVEKYIIRSSDAAAFYTESFPAPVIQGDFITLPFRRRMPGSGFFITKTVEFGPFREERTWDPLGFDPENEEKHDEFCMVTINYETMLESDANPRDPEKPETFLDRQMNAGGEFLTINPKKTAVADVPIGTEATGSDGEPNKDMLMPIIKAVPIQEWTMRWNFAVAPNWEKLIGQLGTVNDDEYVFLENAEVETVLYTGVSAAQTHSWTGRKDEEAEESTVTTWNLDLKFSQRRIEEADEVFGWNHVWSPDKQKFIKPLLGDRQLYRESLFLDLFTADPDVIASF